VELFLGEVYSGTFVLEYFTPSPPVLHIPLRTEPGRRDMPRQLYFSLARRPCKRHTESLVKLSDISQFNYWIGMFLHV
jgi:hypothetical protein